MSAKMVDIAKRARTLKAVLRNTTDQRKLDKEKFVWSKHYF